MIRTTRHPSESCHDQLRGSEANPRTLSADLENNTLISKAPNCITDDTQNEINSFQESLQEASIRLRSSEKEVFLRERENAELREVLTKLQEELGENTHRNDEEDRCRGCALV